MATVGAMRAILSVNSTAFRAGMKGASTSLIGFSGAARATTVAIYRLGGALTAVVGPFIGLYGAIRAMRVAEAFQQEMNSSLAIVDNAGEAIRKRMEKVAFDVAYSTKFSMREAAQAYYYLVSAGLDLEQSMEALPQVAAFAQAGMFDLARATELAAGSQAAMGMKLKDPVANLVQLTRVTDVLVKANKLAQATTEQFAVALGNDAANAGRMAGQSIEEVVGVVAAFAQKMVKGEEAGSAYARAMNYLQIQAVENADAFTKSGVAVFDAAGKTRSLVDVIADLEQRFAGMSDKAVVAEFKLLGFTKKTINLMKLLIGTSDDIRTFTAELYAAGGTAQEVASKQLPPLTAAWQKLKAVMTQWSITNIAPAMAEFGEGLSLLLDSTDRLNESIGGTAGEDMSDRFKAVNMELEGMASWIAYITDLWGGMKIVLKSIETSIEFMLTGAAKLVDVLTFSQFNALGEIVENLGQKTLDSADKVREMWNDPNLGTAADRMVLEQSKKNIEEYRKLRGKETAAGGAPSPVTPPTLTTQAGASGILRGQDASTVTLESQEGKRSKFQKEWLTKDSLKKLADAVAQAAGEGLAKATAGAGGGAGIAGPLEAQMARARRIFDQTRTPFEKFNTAMEDLKTLLDVGAFGGMGGEETYRRAVEGARDAYEKASKAKEPPGPPALARMGSQDAYELVRQNRMGGGPQVAPMVKEQQQTNQNLTEMNESIDEMVSEMREQTAALQGTDLDW